MRNTFQKNLPPANATSVGNLINSAIAKTTPVDADVIALSDSAASNVLKKLSWANIKATLKTYFDGLYAAIGSGVTNSAGANVVPKSNGTNLVASNIADTGAVVTVNAGFGNGGGATFDSSANAVKLGNSTSTLILDETAKTSLLGHDGATSITVDDNGGTIALSATSGATLNGLSLAPISSYLASDYTNATASFTNTALSVPVLNGKKYAFVLRIYAANSQAAEGFKLDFNGGSATAGYFRAGSSTSIATGVTTALNGAFNNGTLTGTNLIIIDGYIEPSSDGTFIVRGAENTHVAGAITFQQGSNLILTQVG